MEEHQDQAVQAQETPQATQEETAQQQNETAEPEAAPSGEQQSDIYGLDSPDQGQEKQESRQYTQAELNQIVQEKLDQLGEAAQQYMQPNQNQSQENKPDYNEQEYAIDDEEKRFRHYLERMYRENQERIAKQREQQENQRLAQKIMEAKSQYADYDKLVIENPVLSTDPVVLEAAKVLDEPGKFLYAAAKNHQEELDKIAKIQNPKLKEKKLYELEFSMRAGNKKASGAPQPVQYQEDSKAQTESSSSSLDDQLREMRKERFGHLMRGRKA